MNIIITAGGTIEPIDAVRSITNKSSGKLGQMIAIECLKQFPNCFIYYLHGKNADELNLDNNFRHECVKIGSADDLLKVVTKLLTRKPIDLFVHAMAVADYTTESVIDTDKLKSLIKNNIHTPTNELIDQLFDDAIIDNSSKISSNSDIMIKLKPTPKIIKSIKELSPYTFLVGFKLVNDVNTETMFNAGFDLLRKNRCNLVLANDLAKINNYRHPGMLIYPEKTMDMFKNKHLIAKNLVQVIANRIDAAHPKSHYIKTWTPIDIQVELFNNTGRRLDKWDLLPHVINHNKTNKIGTYGNMSVRTGKKEFIITGRNIDKTNIKANDLVNVNYVCFEEHDKDLVKTYATVNYSHISENMKPSIDAAIHAKIYERFDINAILHVHTPDKLFLGVPIVYGKHPCGSKPEMDAIVECLNRNPDANIIQLEKHGLMILGASLFDCQLLLDDLFEFNPYIDLSQKMTDQECLDHIKDVDAQFVTDDESYLLKIQDITIGMIWESISDQKIRLIDFGIYVKFEFQRKNLGVIKKYLHMRQGCTMMLHTKDECDITDLYQTKYGFSHFCQKEKDYAILIKKDN